MVIVTSGAVGVGCHRLGLSAKPSQLAKKQALAAVGQVHGVKGGGADGGTWREVGAGGEGEGL